MFRLVRADDLQLDGRRRRPVCYREPGGSRHTQAIDGIRDDGVAEREVVFSHPVGRYISCGADDGTRYARSPNALLDRIDAHMHRA